MPVFQELPDDDAYRFVKWFDRFSLPHAGTQSASVDVLFQPLALRSISEISYLSEAAVQAIVGLDNGATGSGTARAYKPFPFLAGYIPHLQIGNVYRGRTYVGQLPASQRCISLPHESQLKNATIGEWLAPPSGWDANLPYRMMTAKQYEIPFELFARSKCVSFLDHANSIEYVIPRVVIFRAFYASHTLLANAFTSGPWAETADTLISESDFRSGLKTQIDPATGSWDVVLMPSVPENDLAHILALLWFDPHARKCADNIYTAMLRESGTNSDRVWFASAEIPLPSNGSTLTLSVRGLNLLPRMPHIGANSTVPKHTFLVTSISSFPWPPKAPIVRWEKANSNAKGAAQATDLGPPPYSSAQLSEPVGNDVDVTSCADASAHYVNLEASEDRIVIVGAPPLQKILKQSSVRYEGSRRPAQEEPDAPTASAGNFGYGIDGQQPIRHGTITRNRIANFAGLLEAINELGRKDSIPPIRYTTIQPEDETQIERVIGEPCWNFLNIEQRQSGKWPRTGWRMVGERKQRVPRTALVLCISLQGREGYWIEIEPSTPNEGMRSPLLIDLNGDIQKTLCEALEAIVKRRGHHLQAPLDDVLTGNGGGRVCCFRHRYAIDGDQAKWNVGALKVFLTSTFRPPVSLSRAGDF